MIETIETRVPTFWSKQAFPVLGGALSQFAIGTVVVFALASMFGETFRRQPRA
jgi:hypothetical protein